MKIQDVGQRRLLVVAPDLDPRVARVFRSLCHVVDHVRLLVVVVDRGQAVVQVLE